IQDKERSEMITTPLHACLSETAQAEAIIEDAKREAANILLRAHRQADEILAAAARGKTTTLLFRSSESATGGDPLPLDTWRPVSLKRGGPFTFVQFLI